MGAIFPRNLSVNTPAQVKNIYSVAANRSTDTNTAQKMFFKFDFLYRYSDNKNKTRVKDLTVFM